MPNRAHKPAARVKPKPIQKHEHHHYWPYLPAVLLVIATFLVNFMQVGGRHGVLAYATEMSQSGLLSATNNEREEAGAGDLKLNSTLSNAAQAKANDMVKRDYWSHNTPDGDEPWVFIDGVGYKYQKAGENLAYGFSSSSQTINGWMNSPTHKANLLDTAFTEVGFGFANSSDFNDSGNETVVVAMYGKPQVLASSDTAKPIATRKPATTQTPVSAAEVKPVKQKTKVAPITTAAPLVSEPPTQSIAAIQTFTAGRAPWLTFGVGLISGLAVMFLLVKHAAALRHVIKDGERFVLHHPLLDTILIGLVFVGTLLSQTAGFIR